MPTVIDSLVVLLKLDPSQFTDEQKKALERLRQTDRSVASTAKNMEAYGKRASQFFVQVRDSALQLFAVLAGGYGLKEFAQHTVTSTAALGRLAYNIGVSSEELGAWEGAVRAMGGDANAAGASMQNLMLNLQEFALTGHSQVVPFFRAMGIQLADAQGHARSVSDIMTDLNRWAQTVSPQQANFMFRALGLDQDTINLLERTPAEFDRYMNAVKAAGVPTKEQTKAMQDLLSSFSYLGQAMETTGREVLTQWAPDIIHATDATTKWLEANKNTAHEILEITAALVGLMALKPATWVLRLLGLGLAPVLGAGVTSVLGVPAAGAASAAKTYQEGMEGRKLLYVDPWSGIPVYGDRLTQTVPNAPTDVFSLFQQLEGTPSGKPSPAGAIGRNQIMPATAAQYGFDPNRLGEPAYNDMVARAIEADLATRYHGDLDAMTVAYHSGKGAADRWLASGRSNATLGPHTLAYLQHEQRLTGGNVNIGTIVVQTQATDAKGIARDIGNQIKLVTQGNAGTQ